MVKAVALQSSKKAGPTLTQVRIPLGTQMFIWYKYIYGRYRIRFTNDIRCLMLYDAVKLGKKQLYPGPNKWIYNLLTKNE